MSLQLRVVTHSEVGLVRKNNQDSGYASPHLLVVADGMGGAAAGDLASAVAIDTIRSVDDAITGTDMLERMAGAIHQANDRIADLIGADYALEGMGTTVTGALFDGSQLALAHIGDSRAYLLRDGRLERLTHDHSWVQSLIDDGKISEAEAAVHPHRSLLLKVLNGQPANDPDLTMVRLQPGDRLLFCSDGICGLVEDPEIEAALRIDDLEDALHQLVELALAEGGIDNITAILADVVEREDPAAAAEVVVLGAAAERKIPPVGRDDRPAGASEDTLVRGEAAAVDDRAVVGTAPAVAPAAGSEEAEDEARYNPRPPHKRRLLRPLVALLAVLLIAGAGLGAGYAWTRTQFFVGAADEQVAIYQGLPDGLPGLQLARVYEVQPLALSALPPYYQAQVTHGIEVSSLDAARQTVAELTETAKRCAERQPQPTPSPTGIPTTQPTTTNPSPSATNPSATGTPRATSTAAPATSTRTTATASATASLAPGTPPVPTPGTTPGADC